MEFKFEEYKNEHADIWNRINNDSSNSSFLTSLEWIAFQNKRGKETQKFLIKIKLADNWIPAGIIYLETYRRKTAKFVYCPYGPVVLSTLFRRDGENESPYTQLYKAMKLYFGRYLKNHKLNLLRFDPLFPLTRKKEIIDAGFTKSYASAQAQDVWEFVLPVDSSFDSAQDDTEQAGNNLSKRTQQIVKGGETSRLLSAIKKDTRYYINRAIKLGVKVKKASTEEEVIAFGNLMKETTQRKGFINFDTSYYLDQWKALQSKGITEIYLAEYQGKYLAGALMNFHKDTVYYAHGASTSDPELMKVSAPYVLHFEMMKDAQSRGIKKYNFWGIVPKGINHEYRGLSDFKMKFPGQMISYVGPYEIGRFTLGYFVQRIADWWNYRKERYRR